MCPSESHETKDRKVVMSGPSEDGLIPIVSVEREDLSGQNTHSLSLNRCLMRIRDSSLMSVLCLSGDFIVFIH